MWICYTGVLVCGPEGWEQEASCSSGWPGKQNTPVVGLPEKIESIHPTSFIETCSFPHEPEVESAHPTLRPPQSNGPPLAMIACLHSYRTARSDSAPVLGAWAAVDILWDEDQLWPQCDLVWKRAAFNLVKKQLHETGQKYSLAYSVGLHTSLSHSRMCLPVVKANVIKMIGGAERHGKQGHTSMSNHTKLGSASSSILYGHSGRRGLDWPRVQPGTRRSVCQQGVSACQPLTPEKCEKLNNFEFSNQCTSENISGCERRGDSLPPSPSSLFLSQKQLEDCREDFGSALHAARIKEILYITVWFSSEN